MIGSRGVDLSDVFNHSVKLGVTQKHRAINEKIMHEYFEQSCGMVKSEVTSSCNNSSLLKKALYFSGFALAVAVFMLEKHII